MVASYGRDGCARLKVLETRLDDAAEHRRRVEVRTGADSGYVGPSWDNIQQMTYEPWMTNVPVGA